MTLEVLIQTLTQLVQTGTDPRSIVEIWDPDSENWEELTGMTFGDGTIRFYSDDC